jgi:hypothetical protein
MSVNDYFHPELVLMIPHNRFHIPIVHYVVDLKERPLLRCGREREEAKRSVFAVQRISLSSHASKTNDHSASFQSK